jgi:succinate dehydrogenase/fumarate reductase flavoprotein subunit
MTVQDNSRRQDTWDEDVDLVVLGSGGAGLTATVVALNEGLTTLLLEKTDFIGGTTAYSAGTCWIPNNNFQRADGVAGDVDAAIRYLDALVGDLAPRELRLAYVDQGPKMIDYLDRLGVRFWHSSTVVDYHPELPGAGVGRAMEPVTFDGRRLGKQNFACVRRPVREFALFGGTLMVRRTEVNRLLKIYNGSVDAAVLALRLGVRWAFDRTTYPRGTRLAMGNALVATLFHQLLQRGGQVWFGTRTTELITASGRVIGVLAGYQGRKLRIRARRGVVLAAGGFPASPELRERYLPKPTPQFTPASEGCTGDTLLLAQAIGAALGPAQEGNAFWFPSSIGRRKDGSTAVFPHIWDRAKPGLIAVNSAGRRFIDESESYHRFTRAMYRSNASIPTIPAWLVVDSHFLSKYGLGMVYPHLPKRLRKRHINSGYLYSGRTVRELAMRIGVDPGGLEQTVADNNRFARAGVDEEFHKGESLFGQQYGDPTHEPNVNLGPIEKPPFYAMAVVPTPLGTAIGLQTNADAQVLRESGEPIAGLYACGNDANSAMGAMYPGAGCQVGTGMTFGYVAARHAAATVDAGGEVRPTAGG